MQRFAIWITALLLSIGGCAPAYAATPTPTATATPTISASPTPSPSASPSPTGFPILAMDGNGFDTLAVRDAVFHNKTGTTGNINMGVLRLGADLDASGTVNIRTGDPAAGKVATSADTIGTLEWTSGTVVVADALAGPPFTINGGPTLTPMVEVNVTTATYIAFNSFHNAATGANGALKYSGGAYRGAIGAMDFLQDGDEIFNIKPLVPFDATTWTQPSYLTFVANGAHSAGVYPVGVGLISNDNLALAALGQAQLVSAGADVYISGGSGVLIDGTTTGTTIDGVSTTMNGTATVNGLLTANESAVITQSASIEGLKINSSVDNGTAPTLLIQNDAASTVDTGIAFRIKDKAGAPEFSVAYDGATNVGGTFSSGGVAFTNGGLVVSTLFDADCDVDLGIAAANSLSLNGTIDTNVVIGTAGKGIQIKEGSNAKMGQAVLVAGTVTVSTTAVGTNSRIFLTRAVASAVVGELAVGTITNGVSFVINSASTAETSTINWLIFDPS